MIKYTFNNSNVLERLQIDGNYIDLLFKFRTGDFPIEHNHDFYELIVLKKNALINILDGNKTRVTAPTFCLIYPQNVHTIEHTPSEGIPEFYNVTINKVFFEKLAELINENYRDKLTENAHYFTCDRQLYKNIVEQLDCALSLPKSAIKKQQAILKNAVIKLLTEYFTASQPQQKDGKVKQILDVMSNPKNMTLKFYEIAKLIGYCPEHIIRLFTKNNLPTPNATFIQIKLDYSCTLLTSTDYTVSRIAEAIGISEISYYNKLFKKQYGISPTTYRKSHSSLM